MTERLAIIGAGMAAGRMLEHLTEEAAPDAFDITLINAEPRGSYNRIMLSPVLAGETRYSEIVTHDAAWYAARRIDCRFGQRVTAIDRQSQTVTLQTGADIGYDRLVIATGSQPIMLGLPGAELEGVIVYRDFEDTERMMAMGPGQRVVVIGGGLLGLEAAAGMAARGAEVTVVHLMGHLMERQLDPEAGALLKASLEAKGIRICVKAASEAIVGQGRGVAGLRLTDGYTLPCDLLVMAVGIRPAAALAREAGLEVGRGITVDDQMRTSDPNVFALGECVEHRGSLFGLVAPLFDQAKVLADTLAGRPAAYVQQSLATKLKVTGCDLFSAGDFAEANGRENIYYRDPARGIYKRLLVDGERLVGAVLFGETADGPWFHQLIRSGETVAPVREALIFGPACCAMDAAA